MEFKELESLWNRLNQDLESQKKLTNKMIMAMTQERYSNKFSKIELYESIGAAVCVGAGIYISINFFRLDTWYLQLCGIFTVLFLFLLPFLTLQSLRRIRSIKIADLDFRQTIVSFAKEKKRLLFLQRLGIYLSFLLMFTMLPVAAKILSGKDLLLKPGIWYIYFPVMFVFLVFFTRWGYKCYKNITNSAENIIKELE